MNEWVTPTGGVHYHLRALRRKKLWQTHFDNVSRWLSQWHPPFSELILVGPSAGYSLPTPFLERFKKIRIVEPDPLARSLFYLRQRSLGGRLSFLGENVIRSEGDLEKLGASYPQAAFLFCNVLGQLGLISPFKENEDLLSCLFSEVGHLIDQNRAASFHDRLTFLHPPLKTVAPSFLAEVQSLQAHYSNEDFLSQSLWKNLSVREVTDHLTDSIGKGKKRKVHYGLWRFAWHETHLIEFVFLK